MLALLPSQLKVTTKNTRKIDDQAMIRAIMERNEQIPQNSKPRDLLAETTGKHYQNHPNLATSSSAQSGGKSAGNRQGSATTLTFYAQKDCNGESFTISASDTNNGAYDFCGKSFPTTGKPLQTNLLSYKPSGSGEIELHLSCGRDSYWASLIPKVDGCTNFHDWPVSQRVKIKQASYLDSYQPYYPHSVNKTVADYHVVWSGESSRYMGYQCQANYYGFLESKNDITGRWTRVMTAGQADDLALTFPTFYAKRHPYSRRYGPLNKADGIIKWYASVDRPKTRVIVLVDPDNWLTNPIDDIAQKVSKGHIVAQRAWYAGSSKLQELWEKVCKKNCQEKVYATAVPYFVHTDDLEAIAPLWRMYTLMLKERTEVDKPFQKAYQSLQIDWGSEMLGWNFACAHLGLGTTVLPNIQARDVDRPVPPDREKEVKMIHMGRAWFPKHYQPAKRWQHTEGAAW
eukprot:CAMPEP_0197537286 /NCGR_PEP_ID=MMETSP1318-20131121/56410_1 /TAXON_ID=552666 /ORGANISM="Partenskyella glossopodia, Strain RCC365" /LENGTH=456 /DNA_ID=CAMNT_0043095421 /DNA_START=329 /DNA_END=1696 /DNA_ORIENTATION=+